MIIKTEQKFMDGQVPAVIKTVFFISKYASWEIREVKKISEKSSVYIVKVKGDKKRELTYGLDGVLISDKKD